ncbi:hypothetical protein FACS189449_01150 [Alphaproteobacteria bacterium]|nr:hypothetical protein FACS189449_01150 [Alphaproteobacteria bacterium]
MKIIDALKEVKDDRKPNGKEYQLWEIILDLLHNPNADPVMNFDKVSVTLFYFSCKSKSIFHVNNSGDNPKLFIKFYPFVAITVRHNPENLNISENILNNHSNF